MVSPEMFRVEKSEWGTRFSVPKSKERNYVEEGIRELITTGGRIEEVNEFRYLGNVLDCEAGLERAMRARVAAAWKKCRRSKFAR